MKDKIMNEVFLSDVSVGQADNIAGEVWAFSLLTRIYFYLIVLNNKIFWILIFGSTQTCAKCRAGKINSNAQFRYREDFGH